MDATLGSLTNAKLVWVECPRDAMQGWPDFIPTARKITYLNCLLQAGFDILDFGSFVSPKAIPQMVDTAEIVANLQLKGSATKLLAIVANQKGAESACRFEQIHFLGYPFSVSETFQKRNANSTLEVSMQRVERILGLCQSHSKQLVVYISMAFGNPFGDPYSAEIVYHWARRLVDLGINTIAIADTVGLATPVQVFAITEFLIREFPQVEWGVHLHSRPENWRGKIDAALRAGCRRFDGAIRGIGGCPMAGDDLVGNMNSETLIPYFGSLGMQHSIDLTKLAECALMAGEIFA